MTGKSYPPYYWDNILNIWVQVIPPEDEPARKTFGRIQGKKKRNARNKW
ncbi:unnamed protein product [marine sediment metagenome]|uniref:Uncharacterized protein n=1 Tax=marine sediment metagenome TaxID=412755 RepID=X0UAT8_9ZZZZ